MSESTTPRSRRGTIITLHTEAFRIDAVIERSNSIYDLVRLADGHRMSAVPEGVINGQLHQVARFDNGDRPSGRVGRAA